jgi:glyoxylase-like metal-dependent hydrolase (beta-lactamase superfamily II)
MKALAAGVNQLAGFPPNAVNIYLVEDVLIDAGTRFDQKRILRELAGKTARAHALTHAHPDHQGASHAVCEALGIPLWCGTNDADAVESGQLSSGMPPGVASRLSASLAGGPAHPVARRLSEGDEVAGFRVLEMPGHSPGHVAYWRASDGVLILGDVLINMNLFTAIPGLHEPPTFFTPDPAQNRRSARRLLELEREPSLVCFGHGPPLRDGRKLMDFVGRLAS